MQSLNVKNNELFWGDLSVPKLAQKFGTPLYIYDENILIQRIKELQKGPWKIHYALKANPAPALLETMLEYGIGIDAVSANEVEYAIKIGFDPKEIVYTSSSLTEEEARRVIKESVLINLNSVEEVELYGELAPGTEVGIRINPEVKAGHHKITETATEISKFGILLEDIEKALQTAKKYQLKITMVHFHIGSGILDKNLFIKGFQNVLSSIKDLSLPDLTHLNLGGGFGTPYRPEENRLELDGLINEISKLHAEYEKDYGKKIELVIEPGRYLVNECGILVVNTNTISRNKYRTFYRTDTGFNHLLRPTLYGSYHHMVNASRIEGPKEMAIISGNICEGGDVLNEDPREITKADPNDKIAILDSGAYGIAMGMSTYNLRGLPMEIIIKENGNVEVISERQNLDDILGRYESNKKISV